LTFSALDSMTRTGPANRAQSCEQGRATKTKKGGGSNGGKESGKKRDQQIDE
jgi:hypothetical protein